jgi:hypothetical protein
MVFTLIGISRKSTQYLLCAQIHVNDLDPDRVRSRPFWSDPDFSKSLYSPRSDHSASQSNCNPRYGKSVGSESHDFTSKERTVALPLPFFKQQNVSANLSLGLSQHSKVYS